MKEVPYDAEGSFKDSVVTPSETATLITLLIDVPDVSTISEKRIVFADGRNKKSPVKGDLYETWAFDVAKNGSKDYSALLYTITCSGKMKPSDFVFTYKQGGNDYSVPLSDTVTKTPDEFITSKEIAHTMSIVRLDDQDYFCSGAEKSLSNSGTDAEGNKLCYYSRLFHLKNLDADVSLPADISKISYEPDQNTSQNDAISKIKVTITDGEPSFGTNTEKKVYNQLLQLNVSYIVTSDMTDEEKDKLDKCAKKITDFGYLVYNGTDGQVKYSIF